MDKKELEKWLMRFPVWKSLILLINVSNGLNIMNCTLALHGYRTSYNRADFGIDL